MNGASVHVTMDATVADAEGFMCDVIRPIIADGDPPDSLVVLVYDPEDEFLADYHGTLCPSPSPST